MTLPFPRFKVETEEIGSADKEGSGEVRSLTKISISTSFCATSSAYLFGLDV